MCIRDRAYWAQAAQEGAGPQNWRKADANVFLRLYRRVVTQDAAAYEATARRLSGGMEKEFFEQNNAKLQRALREQLGPAAASYLLASSGKRPNTAKYLALPADAITLR